VEVIFRTRKLEREYRQHSKGVKAYGHEVARKYIQRINIIKRVRDIDELMNLPALGCHPLKGDRRGQYAFKLTGFYSLIFTLRGEALEIAHIEEVSKHYGD
jgi:proteic killer suppression protein